MSYTYKNFAVDASGNIQPEVDVTVRTSAGVLASITTAAGGALANPFTSQADGSFEFAAARGRYYYTLGVSATQYPFVLGDPDLATDVAGLGTLFAEFADGGPVACATTANITLSGEQTIDGVLTSASRVLVKDQTAPEENGIYVSASGAWSRATDMDAAGEVARKAVSVTGGTTQARDVWATYSTVTTLGTDAINWVQAQDGGAIDTALALKANIASPTFTGTPAAPTASGGTDTTQIATTAFVRGEVEPVEIGLHQQMVSVLGDVLASTTPTVSVANGATATGGTSHGITIPTGSTGNASYLRPRLPADDASGLNLAGRAGETIRVTVGVETSATFTRTVVPIFQYRDTSLATGTRSATVTVQEIGDFTAYHFDYVVVGDEEELRPTLTISGSATASDETIEITSLVIYQYSGATPAQTGAEIVTAAREAAVKQSLSGTLGDQRQSSGFRYAPSDANGSVSAGDTTTIPTGQTGDNALLFAYWDIPGARWIGRTIETVQVFETSATFNRAPDKVKVLVSLAAGGSEFRDADLTSTIAVDGTTITITSSYTVEGDESRLIWGPQLNSGGAAAGDETITLTGWSARFTTTVGGETPLLQNTNTRLDRHFEAPTVMRYAHGSRNGIHREIVTVATSGGDYTDPVAAVAAANALEAGPGHRVLVEVGPGDFDITSELQPGNFVDIHGMGPIGPTRSLIRWFQSDSATDSEIDDDSVIRLQFNTSLRGLAIWGTNVRYAIHPEIPLVGTILRPVWEIVNCDVRHYAKTSANGLRADATRNAIGSGTGDGYVFTVSDCYLWSETGAGFAWHNNVDHLEPTLVQLRNNRIYGGGGTAIASVAYGSGQADQLRYIGNSLTGDVTLAILSGGDVREVRVTGHGNTPHAITSVASYLPEVTDEERVLSNGSGSAISAGDVLAWDGSEDAVRLMTSADAGSLFAGVALEDIANGDEGRVKIRGWMHLDHLSTAESSLTFNATMSVGGTAGTVAAGGSQGILRAVASEVVEIA